MEGGPEDVSASDVSAATAETIPVMATAATASAIRPLPPCTRPHATGSRSRFQTMVGVFGQFAPRTQNLASPSRPAAKAATSTTSMTTRVASSEPPWASS